jgi:hypothetical protein
LNGVCEIVQIGHSGIQSGRMDLFAWADPENDNLDEPELDEPTGDKTVHLPVSGTLDVEMDLE